MLKDKFTLSINQMLKTSQIYLENQADFFQNVSDKIPETHRKDIFKKIARELNQVKDRLVSFQRRRFAQVKSDQMIHVYAGVLRLLQSLQHQDIFQKSYLGRANASRVVSLSETLHISIQTSILGLLFFQQAAISCPKNTKRVLSEFTDTIQNHLTTLFNIK